MQQLEEAKGTSTTKITPRIEKLVFLKTQFRTVTTQLQKEELVTGNQLYYSLNFTVNLKLLQNHSEIKKLQNNNFKKCNGHLKTMETQPGLLNASNFQLL